jgi:SAM-dependent methyltransferase
MTVPADNRAHRASVRDLPMETVQEDLLLQHLARVPVHRALIRVLEHRLFNRETLPGPILDLGCGDGHFAGVAFPGGIQIGIDSDAASASEARHNGSYRYVVIASGTALPCRDAAYRSVVSNCAIEHIPESDALVAEVARVLAPGGKFVFSVMNDRFTGMLFFVRILLRLRLRTLARAYGCWWNRRAAHHRLDSPEEWNARLARHGLSLESHTYYLSAEATRIFELAHYCFAIPALVCRKLTGRWSLRTASSRPGLAYRWLKPYAAEDWPPTGSASFFVASKPAAPEDKQLLIHAAVQPPVSRD